jgi:hypothetical protein
MDKKKTILGCGLAIGKDRRRLQRSSGIPERTFDRRLADPDKLTLGEFRQIAVATCMPDETIIKMVREIHRRAK